VQHSVCHRLRPHCSFSEVHFIGAALSVPDEDNSMMHRLLDHL
jgi:hypothetical protein